MKYFSSDWDVIFQPGLQAVCVSRHISTADGQPGQEPTEVQKQLDLTQAVDLR